AGGAADAVGGDGVAHLDTARVLTLLQGQADGGRDRGLGLVYAASADSMQGGLGSWTISARRARRGLLIGPKAMAEGDLIGARLTTSVLRGDVHAGRGWMAGPGSTLMAVQVPLTTLKAE
ncbi:hypothetical protein ABT404_49225, partial [Streptomyces hyaluromycini]